MTFPTAAIAPRNLQLLHALAGMPFPARRWQLVSWAVHNGASHLVLARLHALPDRLYRDRADVLNQGNDVSSTPLPRPAGRQAPRTP
jgi:hypothetical protein